MGAGICSKGANEPLDRSDFHLRREMNSPFWNASCLGWVVVDDFGIPPLGRSGGGDAFARHYPLSSLILRTLGWVGPLHDPASGAVNGPSRTTIASLGDRLLGSPRLPCCCWTLPRTVSWMPHRSPSPRQMKAVKPWVSVLRLLSLLAA